MDLVEGGSARVRPAVRAVPNIVRRSTAGRPAQATDILVHLCSSVASRRTSQGRIEYRGQSLGRPEFGRQAVRLRPNMYPGVLRRTTPRGVPPGRTQRRAPRSRSRCARQRSQAREQA